MSTDKTNWLSAKQLKRLIANVRIQQHTAPPSPLDVIQLIADITMSHKFTSLIVSEEGYSYSVSLEGATYLLTVTELLYRVSLKGATYLFTVTELLFP